MAPMVTHPLHSGSKNCLLSAGDSESWRQTQEMLEIVAKNQELCDKLLETVGGAEIVSTLYDAFRLGLISASACRGLI